MNDTNIHKTHRVRRGLIIGALAGLVASVAFVGWSEAREKNDNPPATFEIDRAPIDREASRTSSFAPVVKAISPSVVNVFTTKNGLASGMATHPLLNDPLFRRFFGDPRDGRIPGRPQPTPRQQGLGSGVIVTKDGYILTNNHVVEGADEIKVALNSGKAEYEAKIIGRDPKTDLAVLKVDAKDLPVAVLGDSEYIEVGDVVLAIGNPFGIGQTVTMGIISATGRATLGLDYEDFIQTDAAINPGNSGGALVDAEGRLVGINTAILSRSGGNQGIGFAVPVNLARSVMESLIQDGRVVRGFLGVTIQNVTPGLAEAFGLKGNQGALISEVMPDTPAEKAGLKSGDVVVEIDDRPVEDSRQLKLAIGQIAPGTSVNLKLLRDGKAEHLSVRLDELPETGLFADHGSSTLSPEERLQGVIVKDPDSTDRQRLELPEIIEGALVTEVDPESAAYEGGLRQGDVIREINRTLVRSAKEAVDVANRQKDTTLLLRVWSQGGSRFLVIDES